ncbi:hypothetical protein HYR99_40695 [Candidatus Poribacteria bacterium]|nr:hypothetical protein [Candidatus Poribacteria bacterium]
MTLHRGLLRGYRSGEFFASCHGSRAIQVDKNLNTGVAGGLYKRLVGITEGVFITQADCGSDRSPVTCRLQSGICQKCYGIDLSTGKPVDVGTPVGLLAAQSIGERGTQLTISAFHTGERMVGLLEQADAYFGAKTPAVGALAKILETFSPTPAAQQIQEIPQAAIDAAIREGVQNYHRAPGVKIDKIHFEVILRAMLDYVQMEGTVRIVHRQVYQGQGDVQCLISVRDAIRYHPGWLAQVAGADRVGELAAIIAEAVLTGERDSFVLPREQLMFGKRIQISK